MRSSSVLRCSRIFQSCSRSLQTFSIPRDRISFVKSLSDVRAMSESLSKPDNPVRVIGMDTETRPSFRRGQSNKVSLFQLAIEREYDAAGNEEVYLCDLLTMSRSTEARQALSDLLEPLFLAENVIKIGQRWLEDMRGLSQCCRDMSCWQAMHGLVELQTMHHILAPNTIKSNLKLLTATYLNMNLSKSYQTSNWDARPLNQGQVQYAAADAAVMIRIYRVMQARIANELPGVDIQSLTRSVYGSNPSINVTCRICEKDENLPEAQRTKVFKSESSLLGHYRAAEHDYASLTSVQEELKALSRIAGQAGPLQVETLRVETLDRPV